MASNLTNETWESGVPRLDEVLGGGIPRGSSLFLIGAPGSGKTILASQIAFQAARRGLDVLFLSTLSEPGPRLKRHLRSLSFWDPNLIGSRITLESVVPLLAEGLESLVRAVVHSAQARRADLLVIDGFCTLRDMNSAAAATRAFVSDLSGPLGMLGCTTLITSSQVPDMRGSSPPEFTVSDGIVELAQLDAEGSSTRSLRVWKMRGAAPLLGRHTMRITSDGVAVYPRTEARGQPAAARSDLVRLSTGAAELDQMMSGGPPRASCTLILGASGTGKSRLGAQFLARGVQDGECCLHVSFRQPPGQFFTSSSTVTSELERAAADGRLTLLRQLPAALEADVVIEGVLASLDRSGATRVVVDGIAELEVALPEHRRGSALAALLDQLRARAVTSMIIRDMHQVVSSDLDLTGSSLAVLADNIILLRYVQFGVSFRRNISVLKMRDAAHDQTIRQYLVDEKGLRVGDVEPLAREGRE